MADLGFKKLRVDNWLEPDNAITAFAGVSPDGTIRPIAGEDWLRHILEPQLNQTVPTEVVKLFEVARSTFAYGYFFYPLYTLAIEQLFRVAEAAATHRCAMEGAPKSSRTFAKKVEWLIQNGIISASAGRSWDAIRSGRNIFSHPEGQTVLTPGNVIGILEQITAHINSLFPDG